MTVQEIITKCRNDQLPIGELSEALISLAGEYAYQAENLNDILARKAVLWQKLRADSSSVAEADRKWDSEPEGQQEQLLKLQMKSIEKLMSAIKSRIRVKEMEAQNIV